MLVLYTVSLLTIEPVTHVTCNKWTSFPENLFVFWGENVDPENTKRVMLSHHGVQWPSILQNVHTLE